MTPADLIAGARLLTRPFAPSEDCRAGDVGAVIVSTSGRRYGGVCVEFECGIGFCAEHAAVAKMLEARESRVAWVVAVTAGGAVLPPCGRCREMLWQLDAHNRDARVILAVDEVHTLRELLPYR